MADIRDWGAWLRGRWNWTRYGYERGFPRGCQFTDVDAVVEFDGQSLMIEAKHYDGTGELPSLPLRGQMLLLEQEVRVGKKRVLVVYGCGACNDPYAVYDVATRKMHDWRKLAKAERRRLLKMQIDDALSVERRTPGWEG